MEKKPELICLLGSAMMVARDDHYWPGESETIDPERVSGRRKPDSPLALAEMLATE